MRLSDCFLDIMAYTAHVVRMDAAMAPSYEQVRTNIQRLISQSESRLEGGPFAPDDFHLARFAVFAWVDEVFLASQWPGRSRWQREQLQRLYFQTADAGELFFDKLNTIGAHQRDVREVYYLCLALGFTGQYCKAGDDFLLEQLKNSNLKLLTGSSIGLPSLDTMDLFPEAYPASVSESPGKPYNTRRWSLVTLGAAVAPVVLAAFLWVTYWFILGNIGKTLIHSVP